MLKMKKNLLIQSRHKEKLEHVKSDLLHLLAKPFAMLYVFIPEEISKQVQKKIRTIASFYFPNLQGQETELLFFP